MTARFSYIISFHSGLSLLERTVQALLPLDDDSELVIVADGALEDCLRVASGCEARVVELPHACGPAAARNVGAASTSGDVLVFIDADVAVTRAGIMRMRRIITERPDIAAIFGAYDDCPSDDGFMSQYKNLAHSFVHRTSDRHARTFWAGFGAMRRTAFDAVGGFDSRFARPSVEDIELGYRLTNAGYRILLEPAMACSHLKRWTIASALASDFRDRGIPWTQLIWRYRELNDDLNLRLEYRWSALLACLTLAVVTFGSTRTWVPLALPTLLIVMTAVNVRFYRFFLASRGVWFTARVWAMRPIQDLLNAFSFAVGTVLYFAGLAPHVVAASVRQGQDLGSKTRVVTGNFMKSPTAAHLDRLSQLAVDAMDVTHDRRRKSRSAIMDARP